MTIHFHPGNPSSFVMGQRSQLWRSREVLANPALFFNRFLGCVRRSEQRLGCILKTKVGSRGEIILRRAGLELVFYNRKLQKDWKGKDVFLGAKWVEDKWVLVCSVDRKTDFASLYYDPHYRKPWKNS